MITIEPPNELKHLVRQFWYTTTANSNNTIETLRILADGAPGIVFQHCNGHSSVFMADGSPLPISFFYGQNTNPCINYITGESFIFGVNFQPTAFKKLFSINTSELTNSVLDIEHLFSHSFTEQLLNTTNPQHIIQLFSIQLLQQLSFQYKQDQIVDKSIQLILQKTTTLSSNDLSSYFNISRRQFQRRFKEYAGVCPETYTRIIKFQKAIHLLKNKHYTKLSDIGYELNYTDQSHFIREFKLFTGYTPKSFLKTNIKEQPFHKKDNSLFEPMRIVKY